MKIYLGASDFNKSKKKDIQSSIKKPSCILSSEIVPAGTTWIFEDGSNVSSSRVDGSADGDDNQGKMTTLLS